MRTIGTRRWRLTPALVVVTVLALVVGWWIEARTATLPTSLADAVTAWHEALAATPDPNPRPGDGVYAMATTGSEDVHVLGGLTHRYPDTTPALVLPAADGCTTWRWTPIAERVQERVTCPTSDGLRLASTSSLHAFLGRTDRRTYTCTDDSRAAPADLRPGVTFTARCTSGASDLSGPVSLTMDGRVVDTGEVTVAGSSRPAAHLRIEQTLSGDTTGTATIDRWIDPDTGLLLRERTTTTTSSDSFVGTVGRSETYTLALARSAPYR